MHRYIVWPNMSIMLVSFYPGCVHLLRAVHGFLQAKYSVTEGDTLETIFKLNVKGMTQFPGLVVLGNIRTEATGTAGNSVVIIIYYINILVYAGAEDFESFQSDTTATDASSTDISFFIHNDDIALEDEDKIILIFTPAAPNINDILERNGEYIRATARVDIIDNDCMFTL